jgi:hypothetical protein
MLSLIWVTHMGLRGDRHPDGRAKFCSGKAQTPSENAVRNVFDKKRNNLVYKSVKSDDFSDDRSASEPFVVICSFG